MRKERVHKKQLISLNANKWHLWDSKQTMKTTRNFASFERLGSSHLTTILFITKRGFDFRRFCD